MCRLTAFLGHPEMILSDIVEKPENSLIKQSLHSLEGTHGINADGFGIAWYNQSIDKEPGTFKSTQPAWNDHNLPLIARKIKSSCILTHIRAATVGDVSYQNCHPFTYKNFSFAHNGTIRNFSFYKQKLLKKIGVDLSQNLKGNTDSECLFFLIIHFIEKGYCLSKATTKAIDWIVKEQSTEDLSHFSKLNFILTNGEELIATKFVSKEEKALSLYYKITSENEKLSSLTISSEPLDPSDSAWEKLLDNHFIYANQNTKTWKISPILIK